MRIVYVSLAAGVNVPPVFVEAVKTGAVAETVVWLKIIDPPAPVIATTSAVHKGATLNGTGNVNVIVGDAAKDDAPDVIDILHFCDVPEIDPGVAPVPHPLAPKFPPAQAVPAEDTGPANPVLILDAVVNTLLAAAIAYIATLFSAAVVIVLPPI